jgi:hypothetical protein
LTPYRGVRYHLKEWAQVPNARPTTYKELFNLRHSSLRNVIERRFGVIKRRFPILKFGCEYSLSTQIKLFPALGLLNNYMDAFGEDDTTEEDVESEQGTEHDAETIAQSEDGKEGIALRDRIAREMWVDYQDYVFNGGLLY